MRWLWLSAAVVALDQLSKWLASALLVFHEPLPLVPFVNLTLTHNTGAAFSFLSEAGGWQLWFFTALALVISGLMAFWLSRTARANWRSALPYALVIGGAIGNVIDRQMHGHVIDFIQWYVGNHYWPAFNVADSAIVVGAIGIALSGLFDKNGSRESGAGSR